MIGAFANIFKIPELKRRVIFTAIMLAVYRVGTMIPTPGVDGAQIANWFSQQQGTIFGMFSMFSGGAMERGSVFALGIMPYISASIILQLLTVVIPHLERLSKEGEVGRRKITQYTRYGTVVLSLFQGYMIAYALEQGLLGGGAVLTPGLYFRLMTMITLTAGTAFIMWLGEQISERGIGNGISLIIFAGIVARMPVAIIRLTQQSFEQDRGVLKIVPILAVMVAVIGFIIYVERAQRKIPIQHAKRVIGRKMYGGVSTHLPLRINTAGVIPPIFASSILMFPTTITQFFPDNSILQRLNDWMQPTALLYNLVYVGLIIFFCYFYTAVTFNPVDVAENLKKTGAYVPGRRPGKATADYIDKILTRITFGGALYVATICVLPTILIAQFNVPFYFGGTSLLIVVGVALDTIQQLESHMLTRHYDGFLGGKGKFKGRK
ncbi:MAG: preprotein translocase subunit SecY [Candidatus Lernaella stagnicola]|nr:preprotein translocase subunit SecY [Candidatus Lernaella stagnicola]